MTAGLVSHVHVGQSINRVTDGGEVGEHGTRIPIMEQRALAWATGGTRDECLYICVQPYGMAMS